MNKIIKYISVAAYICLMTVGAGCAKEKNELVHDHAHEHEHSHDHSDHDHDDHDHEGHDHEGHDHGTGDEIELEHEQAAHMGVLTEHIHAGDFNNAILVTGTVTGTPAASGSISCTTSGILTYANNIAPGTHVKRGQVIGHIAAGNVSGGDANAAARADLNAAKRELDRLKPLYEKQLVTAEKYNTALAAYEVAKARYSPAAASGAVTSPVSGVITEILAGQGEFVNAGDIVARVSDGSSLTLTADVPDRYAGEIPSITDARIVLNNNTTIDLADLGGKKITSTAAVSTSPGYLPVVFTFNGDSRIVPGSVVEVFLLGQTSPNTVTVPLSAITEQQGNYFVYIRVDDDGYVKSPVTLGRRDGNRVEILHGVHPHDDVVTEGVTAIRLAETKGAVPEGHSHSH